VVRIWPVEPQDVRLTRKLTLRGKLLTFNIEFRKTKLRRKKKRLTSN
jgi:hypothetical protein